MDFTPRTDLPQIVGDANQLIQVFLNLISNAEQAIHEVRESGRIQIRLSHAGDNVVVTVQDDGVGISPEGMPKLFDPFYTTKRPGGGTGLGLSICLSIAREHGGTIQAESLPGGGSAFSVYLPAVPATPDQLLAKPVVRKGDADSSTGDSPRPTPIILKGIRVLVLDDEESIRSLLEEGLGAHGLKVSCASTAEEAAGLISRQPYDALLCDLRLKSAGPFSDGRAAAAHVLAAAGSCRPRTSIRASPPWPTVPHFCRNPSAFWMYWRSCGKHLSWPGTIQKNNRPPHHATSSAFSSGSLTTLSIHPKIPHIQIHAIRQNFRERVLSRAKLLAERETIDILGDIPFLHRHRISIF